MQRPLLPGKAHRKRGHSGKTGTAAGEKHAFLRSTENFAKGTGIFAGFEYNIRDSSNLK
jgi:hypothetical protein